MNIRVLWKYNRNGCMHKQSKLGRFFFPSPQPGNKASTIHFWMTTQWQFGKGNQQLVSLATPSIQQRACGRESYCVTLPTVTDIPESILIICDLHIDNRIKVESYLVQCRSASCICTADKRPQSEAFCMCYI